MGEAYCHRAKQRVRGSRVQLLGADREASSRRSWQVGRGSCLGRQTADARAAERRWRERGVQHDVAEEARRRGQRVGRFAVGVRTLDVVSMHVRYMPVSDTTRCVLRDICRQTGVGRRGRWQTQAMADTRRWQTHVDGRQSTRRTTATHRRHTGDTPSTPAQTPSTTPARHRLDTAHTGVTTRDGGG